MLYFDKVQQKDTELYNLILEKESIYPFSEISENRVFCLCQKH